MQPAIRPFAPDTETWIPEHCHIIELENTADDPAVSIARARVEPGVTTHRHLLRGTTERYVIIEGHGCVEIDGLAPQDVGPGDVVVIPPGCPQRIANTGTIDLIFLAVCSPRFHPDCYEVLPD